MPMQEPQPMQQPSFDPQQASMLAPEEPPVMEEKPAPPAPAFDVKLAGKSEAKVKLRKETVEKILAHYNEYRQDYQNRIEPLLLAIYRCYHGMRPKDPGPYLWTYIIREGFRQLETLKPQVAGPLLGGDELFRYLPRRDGFEERAATATSAVHYEIRAQELDVELRRALDLCLYYGTAFIVDGWRHFKRLNRKIALLHAPESVDVWDRSSEEVLVDAPFIEVYGPDEFFSNPWIEDPRKSPMCMTAKMVTVGALKSMVRDGYLDADEVEEAIKEGPRENEVQPARDGPRGEGEEYDTRLDEILPEDGLHQLITVWTNNGWEYVLVNDTLCHGQRFEGEAPVTRLANTPQHGKLHGIPELETILDELNLLQDFASMMVDNMHFANVPMFKVKKGTAAGWLASNFRPGGKIEVNNMEDVQELVTDKRSISIMPQILQFVQNNAKQATGITDELSGVGSTGGTATAYSRKQDAATIRMKDKVALLMPPFRRIYARMYDLMACNLSTEKALRLEGADGQYLFGKYGPKDFEAEIDIEVTLAQSMEPNPEVAARWQTILGLCQNNPTIDQQEVYLELFRALGVKRPRRLLVNPARQQQDAMDENANVLATGILPEPRPGENHQVHLQIHMMQTQTPMFQLSPPAVQAELMRHIQQHVGYFQLQQRQSSPAPAPRGPGSVLPEADARTEQRFGNGQRGAMQQGVLQGGGQ